jgi:hypothetical protein
MTDWVIKKITVIAEEKGNPAHTHTLELEEGHLHRFSGMFWATPGSTDLVNRMYAGKILPISPHPDMAAAVGAGGHLPSSTSLKSMAAPGGSDIPAIYLKDPECVLFEFP